MSAHLDKLMMQVALIDQVTKPLKGIQNTVTQTADVGRSGWEKMAGGTAGVVAAGFAVQQALMPAIEMDRVLGEVKSLGVIDKDLQQLQQTALNFSVEYGKSAQEVVGAAYDIKSAFGDISGPELSDITKSSAVLAAATKADTATITDYMGTMYGVFKNQANDMGVGIWSKNVAGMTAQSVEMFKTTGKGMSDAFTSVGANATSAGIKMNEQMAILGSLQSTMSGSEAGTKYKAFLAGVGGAQDKLNMKFVDSQGAMLPMMDILDKLKSQFGDTLDVAESDALKKAFGSEEAVSMIKLLMADTNGLAASINTLGNIKGMSKAEEMAGAMTDQWERLEASWFAIRAGAFGLILPSINAIAGSLADGIHVVLGWTQEFPVLTQYIGYFALAVVGSAAVIAAWNLVMGASSLVMTALKAPLLFTKAAVLGLSQSYKAAKWSVWAFNYSMLKQGVYTKNASVLNKVYATSALFMNRALMMASNGIKAFSLVMLKSAAAMLMNPIFWIPAAIVAVGVAVAALITHWDDIMAALNEIYIFRKVGEALMWVAGVFGQVFSAIGTQWDLFVNAIASSALFQNVVAELSWLFARFSGVFSGIATVASGVWSMVGAGIRFVLSPLNVLYTAFKGFFVFLKDGPEAAMAVWQGIPELFTGIWQSLTAGLSSITSGFMLFASSSMGVLMALAQPFVWLGQQVHALIHGFIQGWTSVMAFISDMSPFQLIGDGIDWLIEKINLIPGIEIGAEAPELSSVATRDMGAINTAMYQPQATARMSQQSLSYGAEYSGLQALPSYQSTVYYQNQLPAQPEFSDIAMNSSVTMPAMPNVPEQSVNYGAEHSGLKALPSYQSSVYYQNQLPVQPEFSDIAMNSSVAMPVMPNVPEQSVNYGAEHSGLKALPSYQSSVYYQNQLPAQPEFSDIAMNSSVAMPVMPNVPEQSVNYGAEHSGLKALPSYQSSVYYQNQLPAQPEFSDIAMNSSVAMPVMPNMPEQSVNYGAEHSGLKALPSYQSSVYYQNQLSGQPELPELNGTATYHSQLMGMDTPEMSVNSANAERVSAPISQYLNGGSERKANMSEQLKMLTTAGNTDNSRTQHMGDVYITQEQPFTRDQLSEWNEMDTP